MTILKRIHWNAMVAMSFQFLTCCLLILLVYALLVHVNGHLPEGIPEMLTGIILPAILKSLHQLSQHVRLFANMPLEDEDEPARPD